MYPVMSYVVAVMTYWLTIKRPVYKSNSTSSSNTSRKFVLSLTDCRALVIVE